MCCRLYEISPSTCSHRSGFLLVRPYVNDIRDLKHRRRWISRTFAGSDFSSVVSCCYGYTVRPWWKVTSTTQDHIVWRPRENAEIKVDFRLKLPFFEDILMPFTTINSLKFLGCCSCSNVKLASSRWGRKFIRWSQQILEVSCQTSLWSLASTLAQGVIWKKIISLRLKLTSPQQINIKSSLRQQTVSSFYFNYFFFILLGSKCDISRNVHNFFSSLLS